MCRFIFGALDHANMGDDTLDQYEMRQLLGQDNHAGLQVKLQTGNPNIKVPQQETAVGAFLQANKNKKKANKGDDMEQLKSASKTKTASKGFGNK